MNFGNFEADDRARNEFKNRRQFTAGMYQMKHERLKCIYYYKVIENRKRAKNKEKVPQNETGRKGRTKGGSGLLGRSHRAEAGKESRKRITEQAE